MVARLNTTPMITTSKDKNHIAQTPEKNQQDQAESKTDPSKNHFISVATLVAILVRISGRPL